MTWHSVWVPLSGIVMRERGVGGGRESLLHSFTPSLTHAHKHTHTHTLLHSLTKAHSHRHKEEVGRLLTSSREEKVCALLIFSVHSSGVSRAANCLECTFTPHCRFDILLQPPPNTEEKRAEKR